MTDRHDEMTRADLHAHARSLLEEIEALVRSSRARIDRSDRMLSETWRMLYRDPVMDRQREIARRLQDSGGEGRDGGSGTLG